MIKAQQAKSARLGAQQAKALQTTVMPATTTATQIDISELMNLMITMMIVVMMMKMMTGMMKEAI